MFITVSSELLKHSQTLNRRIEQCCRTTSDNRLEQQLKRVSKKKNDKKKSNKEARINWEKSTNHFEKSRKQSNKRDRIK